MSDVVFVILRTCGEYSESVDVIGAFFDKEEAERIAAEYNEKSVYYSASYSDWCSRRDPYYWEIINSRPIGVGTLTAEEEASIAAIIGERPTVEIYGHYKVIETTLHTTSPKP